MLITASFRNQLNAQEGSSLNFKNAPGFAPQDSVLEATDSLAQDSTSKVLENKIDTTISKDAIQSRVDYIADDSMRIDMESEKVFLYGNAQVNYENIQLNANYIEVDLKNNQVMANGLPDSNGVMQGLPVFKEGAQEYQAGKMNYNFKTKKGKIIEEKTQEGEGFIKGNEVKKTASEVLYIRNGYYTTCNLDHPHFSLSTSKLKVIPNDKIVTGPTVLKVDDVPTPLGLPFGFFPNKKGRSSGIIIPTYGDSRALGFFLRNGGFYWGISEYLDASITGDIYSLGSWGTALNTRYRKRYKYNGDFNTSFSKRKEGIEETPEYFEINNFFVRWTHSQDSKARPGSRFSANVNVGSRTNFTNNLNSFSQDYLTNTFQSSITYSNNLQGTPFNFTASARHDQNSQTGAFNVNLPDVAFNMSRQYPFKSFGKIGNEWWRNAYKNFGLSYSGTATNQLRTNDTLLSLNNLGELSQDFQNGIRHSIPINTSFKLLKHANISPSFNYSEAWSFETIRKTLIDSSNTSKKDTVIGFERGNNYNFSAALTTKVYSLYQFKKGKVKAVRHVMTPSISYAYQPQNQSGIRSFRDTTGKEITYSIFEESVYRNSNGLRNERLGISLLNNIEMKVKSAKDSSGVKKIKLLENLAFNTNYDLTADSLKWSPINASGRTRLSQFLTLQFNGVLDPYGLYIDSLGNARKINESWQSQSGKLFRFTSGSIALNFSLRGGNGQKPEQKKSKYASEEELEFINNNLDKYIDFTIPWSLNVNYNIRYSKPLVESTVTQTLNFSGDLSVTEKWKIGFNSGWDFETKDFTYTSLNINRDLHCWQLAVNWIPYGPRQSYNLTLNVKSAVLQDLKLNRRRDFYDLIP